MADHQKGKTKAAILQELESIKGLLLEDEDIPLLQEVIDTAEEQTGAEEPLGEDDLAELQEAYRDLLEAHESEEDLSAEEAPVEHSPSARSSSTAERKPEAQVSLFDVDTSLEKPAPAPRTSPGARRSAVTKASGENPFLPAHIRSRLHGNRPPPLLQPGSPLVRANAEPRAEPDRNTSQTLTRRQLIDELVTNILPQLETDLRQRLQNMTEDQLRGLRNDDMSGTDSTE